jgi:hypothetical protein
MASYMSEKEKAYRREYNRKWYEANKERMQEVNRRNHLQREYGITPERYAELLFLQGGTCAICKEECPTGKRLSVDHNHETGEVRGLLCYPCNFWIGHLERQPELFQVAIKYLEGDNGGV